jgi:superfamily II DNA or RNA helicase
LVRARGREWVVLPSDDEDILRLRPLSGSEAEICGIHEAIEGYDVQPAEFPDPEPSTASDFISGRLLRDAARLSLRSGAGPFRSLGRLSVRPRPYQFVPLIMALRLDPVRMLIADDVGVGKTIEAALIAKELLDRGDAQRLCVLCPPHLCDQWERELETKFNLQPVVVRTSTAARLQRELPRPDLSVYAHYPHLVASIDYVKDERHWHEFLTHCPDLVVVDEAHTASRPGASNSSQQQQRYALVKQVAANADRHLLLLTATPHSGIE